jgi:hypothetical protein
MNPSENVQFIVSQRLDAETQTVEPGFTQRPRHIVTQRFRIGFDSGLADLPGTENRSQLGDKPSEKIGVDDGRRSATDVQGAHGRDGAAGFVQRVGVFFGFVDEAPHVSLEELPIPAPDRAAHKITVRAPRAAKWNVHIESDVGDAARVPAFLRGPRIRP